MHIILYSTGCSRCNVLETKLIRKGIEFSIVDDVDKMIEMGYTQAPLLEVDGKIMEFTEANAWINAQEGVN